MSQAWHLGDMALTFTLFQHRFRQFVTLDGQNHKARFGMAVAAIGDINLDGASPNNAKGFNGTYVLLGAINEKSELVGQGGGWLVLVSAWYKIGCKKYERVRK